MEGIPTGSWAIRVEARGHAPEEKVVNVTPGQTAEVEFTLKVGVEMLVRIIGTDGKPLPSAAVTVYNQEGKRLKSEGGGSSMMERFFRGDSGGTRSLGSFAPGQYKLEVENKGKTTETQVGLSAESGIIEIRL